MDVASFENKSYRGRRLSPRLEGLLAGAVCLVFGVLVGRQTRTSDLAPFIPARIGFGTAGAWSPSRLASEPPAPKPYYLPADLGVHHYTVSGAGLTQPPATPCAGPWMPLPRGK